MSNHIVILTGQHMVANPRVWKEANALADTGYNVTVLTTVYDETKLEKDKALLHKDVRYKAAVNLIPGAGFWGERTTARVRRKIAVLIMRWFKKQSESLLVYSLRKQLKAALNENADLYIGHQETGLLIGCALIKKGKNVAFDIEDWYSRDYINKERPVRLLSKYEAYALRHGRYVTCPSKAMAEALCKTYALQNEPDVLYNGFSIKENAQYCSLKKPNSLVWFSQVIGPERGIEVFVSALSGVDKSLEISFVGTLVEGFKDKLESLLPAHHKLSFHSQMEHHQLVPFLAKHSIGLALESTYPESRNTTVTNKILQYLQAGIKVFATNTEGHQEVHKLIPEFVNLVDSKDPTLWPQMVKQMLAAPETNIEYQIGKFSKIYSWEEQAKKLLYQVKNAI